MGYKVWMLPDEYGVDHEFHVCAGVVVYVGSPEYERFMGDHIENVVLDKEVSR